MSSALDVLARERCSAILRTPYAEHAAPAMQAAVEGGFRVVEFTLTTPGALDHIANFRRDPDLLVGAGTVLDVDDARAARRAGARFLVSPCTDPDVIRYARENDLVAIPGTATPTEMIGAQRAGAQVVKLFPAPANVADYLRAVLGPLPFLKVFPTSGVTLENTAEILAAGAFGVGFVGSLFDPEDVQTGAFETLRQRAQRLVQAVRAS